MIDFETAVKVGEEVLALMEKNQIIGPKSGRGVSQRLQLPNLLQFRRELLAIHARRHLVTELAATGKLSESEAQSMVDEGAASTALASGTPFANILAWLEANGPTIAQDIAAAIPIIISLLTLFGG